MKTRQKSKMVALERLLESQDSSRMQVIVSNDGDDKVVMEVSCHALELFRELLEKIEEGTGVEIVRQDQELTTSEAAEILGVSRPYLVDLLEDGEIPFHKVGSHRRVQASDVLEFKRLRRQRSRDAMKELAQEDRKLDVEY
jgi:excisionase family DNA binding protein